MSRYTWGLDGYGRAHVAKRDDLVILFCMLPGNGGQIGVWDLEDQDASENNL